MSTRPFASAPLASSARFSPESAVLPCIARRSWMWGAFALGASLPGVALAEPSVLSPEAGAETSYRQSVIEWQPVPGKTTYHLEIDDDPSFHSPEVDVQVDSTSYALSGTPLKLNGQRRWPTYVRIDGERWNAGTFAPATVYGANQDPSVAVGPTGTVYLSLWNGRAEALP